MSCTGQSDNHDIIYPVSIQILFFFYNHLDVFSVSLDQIVVVTKWCSLTLP